MQVEALKRPQGTLPMDFFYEVTNMTLAPSLVGVFTLFREVASPHASLQEYQLNNLIATMYEKHQMPQANTHTHIRSPSTSYTGTMHFLLHFRMWSCQPRFVDLT